MNVQDTRGEVGRRRCRLRMLSRALRTPGCMAAVGRAAMQWGEQWAMRLFIGTMLLIFAACEAEDRAKEAAEEIRRAVPNVEAAALAQVVEPDVVKEVQGQLAVLNEYQGEINGELDSVTVNAIQAFQRSAEAQQPWWVPPWSRLKDDGILNPHTRTLLAEAAAEYGSTAR